MKLEPGYSAQSLKSGIERAKENIATFKAAIAKERDTIREYDTMIKMIKAKEERAAAMKEEAASRIEVVRE